jgi:Ca-activated chloride channel family protein
MSSVWRTFYFGAPWVLLLLPLTAAVLWWLGRRGRVVGLPVSSVSLMRAVSHPVRARGGFKSNSLRWSAVALLVLALAQPRIEQGTQPETARAIDILLLVDSSRSMDTLDFEAAGKKISRLQALRAVVTDFIKERPQDRIGVIGFAEKPFLLCPLTLDHSWMLESLANVETSLGTAMGSAIEAGVDLLRAGGNRSRVLILITDGLNTSGSDPVQAAKLAAAAGVRLYTIAAVSYDEVQTDHFENSPLYVMAKSTGGAFFQAGNSQSLQSIYGEIDRLERQQLKQLYSHPFTPLFGMLVVLAGLLLAAEVALHSSRWLRVP